MKTIRGRFAPSPSGEMHLGNAWTALLAWLQVRSAGGSMVLRIEDLDPDRCNRRYTAQLLEDMSWIGLDWDEGPDIGGDYGPYCQSERRDFYEEALVKLENQGLVYKCYCTRAEVQSAAAAPHDDAQNTVYPRTCRDYTARQAELKTLAGRKPSFRLMVPDHNIAFTDKLHGYREYNLSRTGGDFIIRRSDGVHAYQLAVVVDDALMSITNVLRGDDLLESTPRQILLYRLLGYRLPEFTHVPLVYSADGHRLSKRQKDLSLRFLRNHGVSAETIVGFLGWKAGLMDSFQPVKPLDLITVFSIDKLPREKVVIKTAQLFN